MLTATFTTYCVLCVTYSMCSLRTTCRLQIATYYLLLITTYYPYVLPVEQAATLRAQSRVYGRMAGCADPDPYPNPNPKPNPNP